MKHKWALEEKLPPEKRRSYDFGEETGGPTANDCGQGRRVLEAVDYGGLWPVVLLDQHDHILHKERGARFAYLIARNVARAFENERVIA